MENTMKVSGKTSVPRLSSAIIQHWEKTGVLTLSCIGAGAISQAIKAISDSNRHFIMHGKILLIKPYFEEVDVPDGGKKTAILLELRAINV